MTARPGNGRIAMQLELTDEETEALAQSAGTLLGFSPRAVSTPALLLKGGSARKWISRTKTSTPATRMMAYLIGLLVEMVYVQDSSILGQKCFLVQNPARGERERPRRGRVRVTADFLARHLFD